MKLILLFVFLANTLTATSYLIKGDNTGAGSCFVGAVQAIVSYFYDRKNKKIPLWLVGIYALSFVAVNLLIFTRLRDLIAMVASLCFVASIIQKNGTRYRITTLICTLLWLTYDILVGSPVIIIHSIQLATVIFGIIIHDVKKTAPTKNAQ